MTMLEKMYTKFSSQRVQLEIHWHNPIRYVQEHFPWAAEEAQQLGVFVVPCYNLVQLP